MDSWWMRDQTVFRDRCWHSGWCDVLVMGDVSTVAASKRPPLSSRICIIAVTGNVSTVAGSKSRPLSH
jgi:hypothetical protein